ncbi:golgin subfamily A member 1-like isoform X2 [Varroa jacobsoni]|uniref:GRIP domain-containing protein n=1 Tax=Varroa destructor TaxID=109461 RepID=A0A7M7M828_VARDE|nr:golgin subfamily A member 1-like isoform X2 [Varroa destructor]XP_022701955.1 golgin subfamily A member 1-like isoform X2 [Varroa jacobsoni]
MFLSADRQKQKELQAKIVEQAEKIQRYETKLSDLVKAYKRLQAERNTLDETIRVLASDRDDYSRGTRQELTASRTTQGGYQLSAATLDQQHSGDGPGSGLASEEGFDDAFQGKISVLTNALATLRVEKTHSEQAYHADKKKLLQEKLELTKMVETLKKDLDEKQQILQQTQAKLSDEKQYREKEAADNLAMMKELQSKLTDERNAREIVYKDTVNKWEQRCHALEAQIDLLKDIEEERRESDVERDVGRKRDAQRDDEVMRELEARAAKDAARANLADEKLNHLQTVTETRIAQLEAQVEELSSSVALYDRTQQQSQNLIQSLKEELARTVAQSRMAAIYSTIDEESNHDISSLLSSVGRSLAMLASANQRSQESVADLALEINRILSKHNFDVHKRCAQDVLDIKQEFESYKELHAASYSKSSHRLSRTDSEESDKVTRLTAQLLAKKQEYNGNIAALNQTIRELQMSIADLKTKHRQELAQVESSWRSRLAASEESMARQRERSMQLLSDRERERDDESDTAAGLLRSTSGNVQAGHGPHTNSIGSGNPQQAAQLLATLSKQRQHELRREGFVSSKTSDEDSMLAELFSLSKSTALGAGSAGKIEMLHYTHEIARKTAEIQQLIKDKKETEMKLYQQSTSFGDRERILRAEVEALTRTIELQKSCSTLKELEKPYLKNVILQYMLCPSSGPRLHMVKAISTALDFTNEEEEQVKQALQRKRILSG